MHVYTVVTSGVRCAFDRFVLASHPAGVFSCAGMLSFAGQLELVGLSMRA